MKPSKSSKAWLKRQETDPYVRRAKSEGYRSRAAFKLIEINERDRLIKPGMLIVDLGAAPGGWSRIAAEKAGARGQVFAIDLLDMQPIRGVTFMRGDIADPKIVAELRQALEGRPVDLVLSDIAPNISGIGHADSSRGIELAQLALAISMMILKQGGCFLVKLFEGAESREFRDELNTCFKEAVTHKPRASRDRSREIYLLGRNFKGGTIGLSSARSISQENR